MTSTALSPARPRTATPFSSFGYLVRCELLKLARIPAFLIPTVLFPIMFFTFFGLPNVGNKMAGGADAGGYIMASFGAYTMLSAALFSFGVSIAGERGLGWNRLMRVTPMSPVSYFAAKTIIALLIGLFTLVLLYLFGAVVGRVSLPLATWAPLTIRTLMGMIPFVALGLWIGYVGGPNSAAGIANLIFLPMSFASGLFTPLQFLPKVVQDVAPYLPAYHSAQLAWDVLGAGDGRGFGAHALWLLGYTVVFLAMAVVAYRRDEGKNFG